MKKLPYALAIIFLLLGLYVVFIYFSWDIFRGMVPNNSAEHVKKIIEGLNGYENKMPAPDVSTASPKLMVIVIDALSYNVLELGFKYELLPNLEKIFASSCAGMSTPSMPMFTPRLLTSMATGVPPEMHGVLDFERAGEAPITGGERKYHAFWHIASERGKKVAIVGWPFTWPAEKVNGYFLSAPGLMSLNYEIYKCCYGSPANELIYQPANGKIYDAIFDALTKAQAFELKDIKFPSRLGFIKFLPFKLNPFFSLRSKFRRDTLETIARRDKFFLEMAKYILANDKNIDIFAIYLELADDASHLYFHDPKTVLGVYAWLDAGIGELLKLVKGEPIMVVLGDHGFKLAARDFNDAYNRMIKNTDWPEIGSHDVIGAFAIRTPRCSTNREFISVAPEEIAPFVLSVFGIPPSNEMENLGLAEWYLMHEVSLGGYSSARVPIDIPILSIMRNPDVYESYKEQLRALGYIN